MSFVFYGVWLWPTGIIQNSRGGVYVKIMPMRVTLYHIYIFLPDDSWYSGLALSFGIWSKALMVEAIWPFKVLQTKLPEKMYLAILMTWVDSHGGAVQLQPNSRLPGKHSKAHCIHKDGENMTWIGPLFFLHIMTHIYISGCSQMISALPPPTLPANEELFFFERR